MEITYLFCDVCNPQFSNDSAYTGTFQGPFEEALDHGWVNHEGSDLCPACWAEELEMRRQIGENETDGVEQLQAGLVKLMVKPTP
jgi:hypothetical protein